MLTMLTMLTLRCRVYGYGYGAYGIEEQAILLNMDAGLPIGTLWDNRKPEKIDADLRQAAEALKPYPAHRGWSWAANWWLEKHGAQAAQDSAEAAEYAVVVTTATRRHRSFRDRALRAPFEFAQAM